HPRCRREDLPSRAPPVQRWAMIVAEPTDAGLFGSMPRYGDLGIHAVIDLRRSFSRAELERAVEAATGDFPIRGCRYEPRLRRAPFLADRQAARPRERPRAAALLPPARPREGHGGLAAPAAAHPGRGEARAPLLHRRLAGGERPAGGDLVLRARAREARLPR